eukprot:365537-Chlamydomonas_euryale.AAC.8
MPAMLAPMQAHLQANNQHLLRQCGCQGSAAVVKDDTGLVLGALLATHVDDCNMPGMSQQAALWLGRSDRQGLVNLGRQGSW